MIKRRCVNPISGDVFEDCSPMDESESVGDSCGDSCGFSVCVPAVSSCVSSTFFGVCVLGEDFCSAPKSEFVEPRSFSLSVKRRALFLESKGGMRMEDTPEKAPPVSRGRVHAIECGVGGALPSACNENGEVSG